MEPGHSSTPKASSPIGVLGAAVAKLEANPCPSHLSGSAELMFSAIKDGFSWPTRIVMNNLWLFGGLLARILSRDHKTATCVRTTTALTIFNAGVKANIIPGQAYAIVNHRIHPRDTAEDVLLWDTKVVNDDRVRIEVYDRNPADGTHTSYSLDDPRSAAAITPASPVSDPSHPAYQCLADSCRAIYPEAAVAPALFVANSDSRWFWDVTENIYRFNPIALHSTELPMFHGIDERIGIDNYLQVVQFFHKFVLDTDNRSAPWPESHSARNVPTATYKYTRGRGNDSMKSKHARRKSPTRT